MRLRVSILLLSTFIASVASAQTSLWHIATNETTFDRALFPVATGEIPGAFGSLWTTDAVVHNSASATRDFDADEVCISECPPRALSAGETRHVLFRGEPAGNPGLIVYVEQPTDLMTFNLRIQDLSRQAQTWGTEIPVVRESSFVLRAIELVNIPMDERFRLMLRVYDIDGQIDARVKVSVFSAAGRGESLGEIELPLQPPSGFHPHYKPSYAQFSEIRGLVPPGQGSTIGLRITPLTNGLRFWAFITVTNDETQHVTTITPQ